MEKEECLRGDLSSAGARKGRTQELTIRYRVCGFEELTEEERELMEAAIEATDRAYAPYSKFHVGAAAMVTGIANPLEQTTGIANPLEQKDYHDLRDAKDYHVVTGSNQENMAYPSGLCAERTALFAASAAYPEGKVTALAIVGRNAKGELTGALPCGACRQVMAEQQMRQGCRMKVICYYHDQVMVFDGIESLLPFGFEM